MIKMAGKNAETTNTGLPLSLSSWNTFSPPEIFHEKFSSDAPPPVTESCWPVTDVTIFSVARVVRPGLNAFLDSSPITRLIQSKVLVTSEATAGWPKGCFKIWYLSLTEHWQAGHPARRPAYWVFGPTKKNAVMGVHLPTVNGQNLQKSIWQELVKREINRIEKTKTSAHLNPLENYTRWNILVPGSAQVLEPQDTRPTRT